MKSTVLSIEPLLQAKKMRELGEAPTDLRSSKDFADRVRGRLLYNYAHKSWMYYDGVRWQSDASGMAMKFAKDVVREWQILAAAEPDDDARKKQLRFAMSAQSRKKIEALVFLAQSDLSTTPAEFDTDPFVLNVLNGTLDPLTGKLRSHSASDMITKLAPVTYDANAQCPRWERFVAEVMENDPDLIAYVQRAFGLCLTGDVRDHVLWIFYGNGANGKSTLLDTMKGVLGDYAQTVDSSIFLAQRERTGPTPELARLAGVRFVAANELPEGGRLSENLVKSLTGGDRIAARRLFSDIVEFAPTWKIAIATNHKPTIRDNSEGLWRRLELIPFDAIFSGDQRDPELAEKLRAEYSGILRWAVDGCRLWKQDGLGKARRISEATQRYRVDSDIISAFVDDCCIVAADAKAPAKVLYSKYAAWCEAGGEKKTTLRGFLTQLRERKQFTDRKSNGTLIFHGLGLLTDDGHAGSGQ